MGIGCWLTENKETHTKFVCCIKIYRWENNSQFRTDAERPKRERSMISHKIKIESGSEDYDDGDQPQKAVVKREEKTGTIKRAATVVKAAATVVKSPGKKGKVKREKSKEDDSTLQIDVQAAGPARNVIRFTVNRNVKLQVFSRGGDVFGATFTNRC